MFWSMEPDVYSRVDLRAPIGNLPLLCVAVLQVSVMFICVRGLDVSSPTGSIIAHKLMKRTQRAVYTMVTAEYSSTVEWSSCCASRLKRLYTLAIRLFRKGLLTNFWLTIRACYSWSCLACPPFTISMTLYGVGYAFCGV